MVSVLTLKDGAQVLNLTMSRSTLVNQRTLLTRTGCLRKMPSEVWETALVIVSRPRPWPLELVLMLPNVTSLVAKDFAGIKMVLSSLMMASLTSVWLPLPLWGPPIRLKPEISSLGHAPLLPMLIRNSLIILKLVLPRPQVQDAWKRTPPPTPPAKRRQHP